MNANDLNVWLDKLLRYYRQKATKLSPEEQQHLVYNMDSPCQVHVLWSTNNQPQSNYQLLIFTHFLEKPDLNFSILGPFEPYRFSEYAAKLLDDQQWNYELPHQDSEVFWEIAEKNYRELLIRILRGFYRSHERYFTQRALLSNGFPNDLIASRQSLIFEKQDFLWEIWGNVTTLDPEKLIDEDFADAQMSLNRLRDTRKSVKKNAAKSPKRPPGVGALLFPPIWIGTKPIQSVEDQIRGKYIQTQIVWKGDYGDSMILLRQDGFITIILPDDTLEWDRKIIALEKMNELIAGLFLLGIQLEAIREHDLVEVTVDPETTRLGSMSWSPDYMRRPVDSAELSGWVAIDSFPLSMSRTKITEENLTAALQLVKNFTYNPTTRNLASFILEAYTLMRNAEYSQSFLWSWLVIETYIGILWRNYVKSRKVDNQRTKRLEDPNRWSADYLLEIINLVGKLKKGEYDELMKLKSKRNKVIHSGTRVTDSEARKCLELATEVVKKHIL